ncbi:MAG: glycosyltransferase [Bacteroidales bacterium]
MTVLLVISFLFLLGYVSALAFFWPSGGDPAPDPPAGPEAMSLPGLTVLVPFRDEEKQLSRLVRDLAAQDYPTEKLDILFIDDHSRDGGAALLGSLLPAHPHMRSLALGPGREGKKAALARGVEAAKHAWILQMDADVCPGPRHARTLMSHGVRAGADLVAGPVAVRGRGVIGLFQELDVLSMTGLSAGSFRRGRAQVCSGANLLYSKVLYEETRSADPSGAVASGDDMFLMIGARLLGRTLVFCADPDALVVTSPESGWRSLIRQRVRWAAKAPHYKLPEIRFFAGWVTLTNVLLWGLAGAGIAGAGPGWWSFLPLGMKCGVDFLYLRKAASITGSRRRMTGFLVVFLLYVPVYASVALSMLGGRTNWKGRVVRAR